MPEPAKTRALYNADCPVCDAEMCSYEGYAQSQDLSIAFDDLNTVDLARWGVSEDQAARLLHVIHDGELFVGWDAFLVLWAQMPRYALAAKIGGWPIIRHVASWGYKHIVARVIYERHLRRKSRGLNEKASGPAASDKT